ncbi:cytochrome P450 [Syncephalis pseudoplumigaleata]|uniref:Cytochrome P450 n=1 Tax=Syncephalis pseudoplumigaleata TaxID=1712513 RepID=A0A4P9Z0K2_9FUNG|nr:cytochrome P450 [Syncephalis pseudoplumigaleata]|eukprot:RKP25993.1 cytochrome P450 [Syncephalis pseudoplumigaleata]
MPVFSTLLGSLADIVLDWQFAGVTLGALVVGRIIYDEFFSPIANVPGVRPHFFGKFLPVYHLIRGNYNNYSAALSERYGKIYRLGKNKVGTTDLETIKLLYSSTRFNKSELYRSFEFHRDNIFSTRNVAFHRKLKRMMAPAFSSLAVAEMEPLVHRAGIAPLVQRLNAHADDGQTFDIMAVLHYATLDVIGEVAFGESFHTLTVKPGEKAHPILHWIDDICYLGLLREGLGVLCNPWLFPRHFESERLLIDFSRSVIEKRKAETAANADKPKERVDDVLQRMLDSEDPETGEKMDVDQMIAETIIQLIAGTDTTALTVTWALHLLHDHPETCRLLQKELAEAFPDRNQHFVHNDLKSLPYLNATIWETLRFRPVGGASQRTIPKGGAVICGHYFPEGYIIHPATPAVHRLPEIFGEDAREFRPGRWLDSSPDQLKLMRQFILTFSLGARSCLGQTLAWIELRLILATIVRRFSFAVPAGAETDMTPLFLFTVKPRGNCYNVQLTHNDV